MLIFRSTKQSLQSMVTCHYSEGSLFPRLVIPKVCNHESWFYNTNINPNPNPNSGFRNNEPRTMDIRYHEMSINQYQFDNWLGIASRVIWISSNWITLDTFLIISELQSLENENTDCISVTSSAWLEQRFEPLIHYTHPPHPNWMSELFIQNAAVLQVWISINSFGFYWNERIQQIWSNLFRIVTHKIIFFVISAYKEVGIKINPIFWVSKISENRSNSWLR